ncbi:MAG: regulator, partial [Candidatus Bathyarchaeia archaeon]
EVGYDKLASAGIAYKGLEILSGGAILVGLIWAAIGAFVIDREWNKAAAFSLLGAVLSFVGIIHSGRVAFAAAWEATIGYLILIAIFLLIKLYRKSEKEVR